MSKEIPLDFETPWQQPNFTLQQLPMSPYDKWKQQRGEGAGRLKGRGNGQKESWGRKGKWSK